jgi:hypothetical protein
VDGQWVAEIAAWSTTTSVYARSFHYTFPPESAIAQISLSERSDNPPGNFRLADAHFTDFTTADGQVHDVFDADGDHSTIVANNLTEIHGYLIVGSCSARAIINVFFWPIVY